VGLVEVQAPAGRGLVAGAPDQGDGVVAGAPEEGAHGAGVREVDAVVRAAVRAVEQGAAREGGVAALAEGVELALHLLVQVHAEGAEDHGEGAPGAPQLAEQEVEGLQEPAGLAALDDLLLRLALQLGEELLQVRAQGLARLAGPAEGAHGRSAPLLHHLQLVPVVRRGHRILLHNKLSIADEALPRRRVVRLRAHQDPHLRAIGLLGLDAPSAPRQRVREQVLPRSVCQRVGNQDRVVHVKVQDQVWLFKLDCRSPR